MFEERKDKNIIGTAVYDPKYQEERSIRIWKELGYVEDDFDKYLSHNHGVLENAKFEVCRHYINRKGYNDEMPLAIMKFKSIRVNKTCDSDTDSFLYWFYKSAYDFFEKYKNTNTRRVPNAVAVLIGETITTCLSRYKAKEQTKEIMFVSGDITYRISFKYESEGNK